MIELVKKITPDYLKKKYHARRQRKLKEYVASLEKISEDKFIEILSNDLGIKNGDLVMIHSSLDQLNLDFPSINSLNLILNLIGENGTVLFPTFPKLNSYNFLESGEVFKVYRTPSHMGLLSELARRHTKAVRSIHPTKSVVAIGPLAEELCGEHHNSILPYDSQSPFYKIYQRSGKAVGLGVKTTYFSAVHVIDDLIPDKLPVKPYHKKIYEAKCILKDKSELVVKTPAHDMSKMHFDLPDFFKKHYNNHLCKDIQIAGSDYFVADLKPLFDDMLNKANNGISIYKY